MVAGLQGTEAGGCHRCPRYMVRLEVGGGRDGEIPGPSAVGGWRRWRDSRSIGPGGPRPRGNPTWVPSPALRDSTSPWVLTRDPRGRSLPDVNECDSSPCSQECANVYGSYQCYCRRGYQLSDVDGVTCEGERMAPCTPSPSRLPGRGALCLFLLTEGRLGTPNPLSRVRFPKAKATHQVFL